MINPIEIETEIARTGYVYVQPGHLELEQPYLWDFLGSPVPQYDGQLVRDIKPNPSISDEEVSASNTARLTPHTEWYEFPGLPPRYVALTCIRQAEGAGGETTIADGYELLSKFTEQELQNMHETEYEWISVPTLAHEGVQPQSSMHPLLEKHRGITVLRFGIGDLMATDESSRRYVEVGARFFRDEHIAIKIETGAALIWDNWRMIHSRNSFSDRHRHLQRVLIAQKEHD